MGLILAYKCWCAVSERMWLVQCHPKKAENLSSGLNGNGNARMGGWCCGGPYKGSAAAVTVTPKEPVLDYPN